MPHLLTGPRHRRAATATDDTDDCSPFDIACILGGGDDPATTTDPLGGLFPPTKTSSIATSTKTSSSISSSKTSSSTTSSSTTTTTSSSTTSSITTSSATTTSSIPLLIPTSPAATSSGTDANLIATATPAAAGFLHNPAAEGAVFGIAGLAGLILLIVIVTWRMRKSRNERLYNEAISFEPPMPDMQQNRMSLDQRSLYGRGSNSGHGHGGYGGAPYVEAYNVPPMMPMNHQQYYNPAPPPQEFRPPSAYSSMDPYGGVELAYDQPPQYPVYPVSRPGGPAEKMYPAYQGQGYQQPQKQPLSPMVHQSRLEQSLPEIPAASLRVPVPPVDPKPAVSHAASPSVDSSASRPSVSVENSSESATKIPTAAPLPDTFGEDLTPPPAEVKKEEPVVAAPAPTELAVEREGEPRPDSVLDGAQYFSPQPLKVANE